MPDFQTQRLSMVESQVRTNDVTDIRIQGAMREVPREIFVPEAKRSLAYADSVVEVGPGRFLLDPRTFSKMAQLAQITPSDRVLEVGCASGYSTAVLARLAGHITAVEENNELEEIASRLLQTLAVSATVRHAKMSDGCSSGAPYDVVFLNGATEVEPRELIDQLAESGRLVAVLREDMRSRAFLFVREQGRVSGRPAFDAYVPVLPGFARAKAFAF